MVCLDSTATEERPMPQKHYRDLEGKTPEEQEALRQQYFESFREGVEKTLENEIDGHERKMTIIGLITLGVFVSVLGLAVWL